MVARLTALAGALALVAMAGFYFGLALLLGTVLALAGLYLKWKTIRRWACGHREKAKE